VSSPVDTTRAQERRHDCCSMSVAALIVDVCCVLGATLSMSFRHQYEEKKNLKYRVQVDRACGRSAHVCGNLERYADGIQSEAWAFRQSARFVDPVLLGSSLHSRPRKGQVAGWDSVDKTATTVGVELKALNLLAQQGSGKKKKRRNCRCWRNIRIQAGD